MVTPKSTAGGNELPADEQVFRFNERKTNDAGRFALVMPGVVGKRITYKELIGIAQLEGLTSSEGAEGEKAN